MTPVATSSAGSTPAPIVRPDRWSAAVAVVAVSLALGAAVQIAARGTVTAGGLVALLVLLVLCACGARRTLLALAVASVPFQLGIRLGFREEAAAVGSLGGLDVSLTTAAVVGLWALWVTSWLARADVPALQVRAAAPFLALTAAIAASALVAADWVLAGFEAALLVETSLLLVMLLTWLRRPADRRFVLACLLASGAVQAVLVLGGRLVGGIPGLRVDAFDGGGARSGGTIGSPNNAGGFFAALLVVALAVALGAPHARRSRPALAAVPLAAAALVLTASRGAWAGAAVGVVLVVAVAAGRGWIDALRAIVGAGFLVVAVVLGAGPVVERLTSDDGGATAGREQLVEMTADVIAAEPLTGVGAGNLGPTLLDHRAVHDDDTWVYTVHNRYLLVWAEAGVLALAAHLWFLAASVRAAVAGARSPNPEDAALAIGAGAAILALATQMLVEPFGSRPQVQLLALLAALAGAVALSVRAPEVRRG